MKHSVDTMLDAARDLIYRGGPRGVSAIGVAEAIGAPSGSVYHRFPRRDDLVAATWLRAQERFAENFAAAANKGSSEPGVAAAVSVVSWTQRHPAEATVLLRYSLAELLRGDVSPELASMARKGRRSVTSVLGLLAERHAVSLADITLAVVDLPYAVVRRSLEAGRKPAHADVDRVRRAAHVLLHS